MYGTAKNERSVQNTRIKYDNKTMYVCVHNGKKEREAGDREIEGVIEAG